jgi:hypothetical protein
MPALNPGTRTRQAVSSRIQQIIDEGYGNFYRFRRLLEKQGRDDLISTFRGLLPPQLRWKEKPSGAAVRPEDWDAVKLPEAGTLIEFCEITNASPNYLLFGEGSPLRGQTRDARTLEEDFSAAVKREVLERIAKDALAKHMRAMTPGARRYLRDQIVKRWIGLPSDLTRVAIRRCADETMARSALMVQSLVSGYFAEMVDDARKKIAALHPAGTNAEAQEVAKHLREVVKELRRQSSTHTRRQVARIVRRSATEHPGSVAKTTRQRRRRS